MAVKLPNRSLISSGRQNLISDIQNTEQESVVNLGIMTWDLISGIHL